MLKAAITVHFGPFSHEFDLAVPENAVEDELLSLDGGTFTSSCSAAESADGITLTASATLPIFGAQTLSDDIPLNALERKVADWLLSSGRELLATLAISKVAA